MPRCAARPGAQWLSLSARDNCACISPWMGWHSIGHRGWGLFATGTVHTRDTYSGRTARLSVQFGSAVNIRQCYSALCCNTHFGNSNRIGGTDCSSTSCGRGATKRRCRSSRARRTRQCRSSSESVTVKARIAPKQTVTSLVRAVDTLTYWSTDFATHRRKCAKSTVYRSDHCAALHCRVSTVQ
jgi:hypothetical protein